MTGLEPAPYKPEFVAKVRELANNNAADPGVNCFLLGTPRSYPFPFKIVQSPKETIILCEAMRTFRDIPTDGRSHTPDPDNTFMGESIGRWEGDTLVVDTVGFNNKTWLVGRGTFHTEALYGGGGDKGRRSIRAGTNQAGLMARKKNNLSFFTGPPTVPPN